MLQPACRYVEVEVMDGENQYKAEGHGLQDARKGVLFDNFPPVLQLQLKRFEYDFQRDTMVKVSQALLSVVVLYYHHAGSCKLLFTLFAVICCWLAAM